LLEVTKRSYKTEGDNMMLEYFIVGAALGTIIGITIAFIKILMKK